MPVYFFTFHAYRSWPANHPKGYIQRDSPGYRGPNSKLADHREASAVPMPYVLRNISNAS